jgi:hypothetical protein
MSNLLGTYDNINQAYADFPSGGVEGDYVIIGGVNYYWDCYLRGWFTEQQTIVIPSNTIQETNNLGVFTSIEAVRIAFPNGGQEGDYLTVDSNRYHWNKWEKIWETSAEVVVAPPNYYVNDLGTFTTMDEVWELYPDGRDTGDFLTINSIRYYWDEYNQCWNSETGIAPFLELLDKTNKGNFATIDAVYTAFPDGGTDGDYLFIDGTKYRWNKYIAVWVGVDSEPAGSHATNNINGDLYVQKDLVVGGNLRVKGLISKYDRLYQLLLKTEAEHVSSVESEINTFKNTVNNALSSAENNSNTAVGGVSEQLINELKNIREEIARQYLRKDIQDTAQEEIAFTKGLSAREIVKLYAGLDINGRGIDETGDATLGDVKGTGFQTEGSINGQIGFKVIKDEYGNTYTQTDYLQVMKKAIFNELEIRKLSAVGGTTLLSPAASKITSVERLDSNGAVIEPSDLSTLVAAYRCYLYTDDGTTATTNTWNIGDQARHETFNVKQVGGTAGNRYYWRVVTEVSEKLGERDAYIVLSNESPYADGFHTVDGIDITSDAPQADDAVVACGVNETWWLANEITTGGAVTFPYERSCAIILDSADASVKGGRIRVIDRVLNFSLNDTTATLDLSNKGLTIKADSLHYITPDNRVIPPTISYDSYDSTVKYPYHSVVPYNGETWMCVAQNGSTLNTVPSATNTEWVKYAAKGDSSFHVEIYTDKGTIIRNGLGNITLVAMVYYGSQNVTSLLGMSDFSWTRTSGDETNDSAWNLTHAGIGNTLTIDKTDVIKRSNFDCYVNTDSIII